MDSPLAELVIDTVELVQNNQNKGRDPHAKSTLGPLWLCIPDNGMAIKFLIKYLQIKLVVLYKYRLLIYILRLFMLVLYSKISFKPKGSKCFFCLISSATLAQVLKSSCLQPITLYLLKKGSIFS